MKWRGQQFSSRWLVVILMGLSVLSILWGPTFAARGRRILHAAMAPLGDGGTYLATTFQSYLERISSEDISAAEARSVKKNNKELLRRLNAIEYNRQYWRRQVAVIQNIRERFGAIRDLPCELIPARVLGREPLPYGATLPLKTRGSTGARTGAAVTTRHLLTDRSKALPPNLATISGAALVGRLVDSWAFGARVQLITDRGFRIRARIRRIINPAKPRLITVVTEAASVETLSPSNNIAIDVEAAGDGGGFIIVKNVNAYDNVLAGDLLVTAPDAVFLPVEMGIGQVVEVRKDPRHPFVSLRVRPHADLVAVREVYIVVPRGVSKEADH